MIVATKFHHIYTWRDKIKAIYLIIIGKIDCVSQIVMAKDFYK